MLHSYSRNSFLEGCLRDVCMSLKIAYSGCCISTLSFAWLLRVGWGANQSTGQAQSRPRGQSFQCNHTVMRTSGQYLPLCLPKYLRRAQQGVQSRNIPPDKTDAKHASSPMLLYAVVHWLSFVRVIHVPLAAVVLSTANHSGGEIRFALRFLAVV